MEKNRISGFEIIVTAVIGLVVIQTFLEDFAVIMNWGENAYQVMMIAGFCFDLFFTIEFLIRLYISRFEKGAMYYFVHGQGWVDFCASIPLLIASSGPQMITYISSTTGIIAGVAFTGVFSMLKLIKTIRIARILRLLRIIKIFKSIKYADSPMAQRHLRKIITIGVASLVISLFALTIVFESFTLSKSGEMYENGRMKIISSIKESENMNQLNGVLKGISLFDAGHTILIIKNNGQTLYSRFTQDVYDSEYTEEDYEYRRDGALEVFFDTKEENKTISRIQSRDSLIFFFIVLLIIGGYLFIYSPHFALTISDPIYVMKRGLEEKNYNLEVKIPYLFKEDDVFKLAKLYNEGYLPLKDRNMSEVEHSVLDNVGLSDLTELKDE